MTSGEDLNNPNNYKNIVNNINNNIVSANTPLINKT